MEEEFALTLKDSIWIGKESHKKSKGMEKSMFQEQLKHGWAASAGGINLGTEMFTFAAQNADIQFYTCSFMKMKAVKRFLYAVDTSSDHMGIKVISESSVVIM